MQDKHKNLKKPDINYGLRGTKYFIEVPYYGENVDALGILTSVQ